MYLYQYIFDKNSYISNILFKFLDHKLFTSISNEKVWVSKVYINLI